MGFKLQPLLSFSLSHSVAGCNPGGDEEERRADHCSHLSHPCSLLPLLLLCLHDRLLPGSAHLSWIKPSRETSRSSLRTTPPCTEKWIWFLTLSCLCLINDNFCWNSGSTSKWMGTKQGCQTITWLLACLKFYYFAFHHSFLVHINNVKQFLPVELDWESDVKQRRSLA